MIEKLYPFKYDWLNEWHIEWRIRFIALFSLALLYPDCLQLGKIPLDIPFDQHQSIWIFTQQINSRFTISKCIIFLFAIVCFMIIIISAKEIRQQNCYCWLNAFCAFEGIDQVKPKKRYKRSIYSVHYTLTIKICDLRYSSVVLIKRRKVIKSRILTQKYCRPDSKPNAFVHQRKNQFECVKKETL